MKIHWARWDNSPRQNPYIKVACLTWAKRENTNKLPKNSTCSRCVNVFSRKKKIEMYDREVDKLREKFF